MYDWKPEGGGGGGVRSGISRGDRQGVCSLKMLILWTFLVHKQSMN